jgi:hypothetical protein
MQYAEQVYTQLQKMPEFLQIPTGSRLSLESCLGTSITLVPVR